jgi:uncharacterized membrane protein
MKLLLVSLLYLIGPVVIITIFQRSGIARKAGTILLSYLMGIIMSFSGLMDFSQLEKPDVAAIQDWMMNIAVPLAIPLMLFSSDFKLWSKSMKKTFAALLGGVISVVVAIVAGFFLFQDKNLPELWKVSGMMVGMYTGGTMNFAAIGRILEVDSTVFTLISAFEMVLSFLFLMFIISGGYRLFRKLLPFHDESTTLEASDMVYNVEQYDAMFKRKTVGKTGLGLLLSVLLLVVGAGLSLLLTERLNELVVIFTITSLAIGASFISKIRTLPKTFELGMYFINVFSVVIASQFDLASLNKGNLLMLAFIGFVIVVATLVHLLLSRLFKVDGDLFTVAHVGLLYSPPFVPPVVAAMGNRKVLISGIVIGLAGYAIGTYLGVAFASLLRLI